MCMRARRTVQLEAAAGPAWVPATSRIPAIIFGECRRCAGPTTRDADAREKHAGSERVLRVSLANSLDFLNESLALFLGGLRGSVI